MRPPMIGFGCFPSKNGLPGRFNLRKTGGPGRFGKLFRKEWFSNAETHNLEKGGKFVLACQIRLDQAKIRRYYFWSWKSREASSQKQVESTTH